ncbi:MAG TPA: iron-sulfur cluster repair di-iron protein [Pyrinomonadaceae bacterium]|nr:iron-sulfur cluster repair di-iron protein [Acidobacteriota bacterium]HQZ97559.1 iron-sulfur cluster repair di-iron protein [Pyrinomonadaceae bacterium]
MINVEGKTVREIALAMPVTTRVFEEFKIDYCCHGNTPFEEACRNVGANPETVIQKIDGVLDLPNAGDQDSFAEMRLSDLVDHILDKHHVYTKDETYHLTPLMAKVATRHGEHNPYLIELKGLFQSLCEDLAPHMMKEEMVLFPYIQKLEYSYANHLNVSYPPFGTVRHPVNMMEIEHDEVGELLAKMRAVTNDYTLPAEACPSFTALYLRLGELERDLHQHIHLENNLLFPRAIEMEQIVFSPVVN